MESNKNNNNNNGDEQPQLRNSARKRKLKHLANNGKPAAGGEEDKPEPEEEVSSNKMNREENDQDLEQFVQLPQVTGENQIADENEEETELPTLQPMKIEMSKETWFEMLTFVGRRQLGQLVPQVGDRRFAGIAQPFLHNYGGITLSNICISGPEHRLIQPALEMPENVTDFLFICFSYLNTPVINLLQKFKQASLFGNANLDVRLHPLGTRNELRNTLSHILPSIDNINSIRGWTIAQLAAFYRYNANANSEMATKMLKMARFLDIYHYDFNFAPSEIAFLLRWLHTPRDDGKPRVLILPFDYSPVPAIDKIPHFIDDTIKSEFVKAKRPVCFFIRFFVRDTVDWHDSSMENGETNEKLVIKTTSEPIDQQRMALISRYPLAAGKHWIEANEREAINWDFDEQNSRICLNRSVRNAIGSEDDNWPNNDPNADGENGQDGQGGGSRANPNYGDRDRHNGDRRGLHRGMGFARRGYQGMATHCIMEGGVCVIRGCGGRGGGFQGRGGGEGGGRGGAGGQGRGRGRVGRGGEEGPGEEARRGLRLRREPIYFRTGQ